MILPDVLREGLSLVICGTAPGKASMMARSYFAHPGNVFWKTLHEVGLTPYRLEPSSYADLLKYGIGLTGLNKTEWGADAELSPERFDIPSFTEKMHRFRPKVIAFESKHAACKFYSCTRVEYGLQKDLLYGIPVYVCPSTSGRARKYFNLSVWKELSDLIKPQC